MNFKDVLQQQKVTLQYTVYSEHVCVVLFPPVLLEYSLLLLLGEDELGGHADGQTLLVAAVGAVLPVLAVHRTPALHTTSTTHTFNQ